MVVGEVLFERAGADLLTEGSPAISFLESAAVATHHRQLFELLWRSAKPV